MLDHIYIFNSWINNLFVCYISHIYHAIDTGFLFMISMDPNYRYRSQHEDEIMLFVLPTIEGSSSHPSSSKKPIHTSKLTRAFVLMNS